MPAHKKTHCIHGHEFTPENTYIEPRTGKRQCKECRTIRCKGEIHNSHVSAHRKRRKIEALTHYGKDGKLKCCWEGCTINDIDMLSLDHIKDDGAEHRREIAENRDSYSGRGNDMYQWIRQQGFPEGFQTLCMNHQFKKQKMKYSANRYKITISPLGKIKS